MVHDQKYPFRDVKLRGARLAKTYMKLAIKVHCMRRSRKYFRGRVEIYGYLKLPWGPRPIFLEFLLVREFRKFEFSWGGGVASDTLAPSRSPHALLYVLDVNTYVHIYMCAVYIVPLRTTYSPHLFTPFFHTLVLIFNEYCIIYGWEILFNYFCKFINLYPHWHCLVT